RRCRLPLFGPGHCRHRRGHDVGRAGLPQHAGRRSLDTSGCRHRPGRSPPAHGSAARLSIDHPNAKPILMRMIETAAKPTRWYYDPTVLIVAGCLVAVVSFGARATMGLFTYPISEAHQWQRETYGFAMAIQNLAWGI